MFQGIFCWTTRQSSSGAGKSGSFMAAEGESEASGQGALLSIQLRSSLGATGLGELWGGGDSKGLSGALS